MAYGKIKADTLVYDNSGTDTDVTVVSLTTKASLPASAGTVGASEVVQVDANKDITGFRNVTLSGDLTVNGTTTTINSTTLTVDDKNIELGTVDTPTDTTADGGGITLKGATDKEIKWINATDSWTFNQAIEVKGASGAGGIIQLTADAGEDNNDKWRILASDGGDFYLQNYVSGGWSDTMLKAVADGTVELYHDNSKKFETTAAGVTVTGTVTDSKGELRNIPQLSKSAQHTIVTADAGKHVYSSTGGWILNASTDFAIGDAITLINNSGSDQTLTVTGATCYNAADAATGNRTLAGRGMATLICVATDTYYISGAGLS